MISVKGYDHIRQRGQGGGFTLFSGRRTTTSSPVVLKHWPADTLSFSDIDKISHKFDLLRDLDSHHILKATELIKDVGPKGNGITIVYDDSSWMSLDKHLAKNRINNEEFLKIAIQLVKAVKDIHQAGLILNELRSSSVAIDPESQQIKIKMFGPLVILNPGILKHENIDIHNPLFKDTLPYFSPEQTGWMSQKVDYRTDFYSLGVVFYELLIGEPPFSSADPMELFHAHIARQPVPPSERLSNIPAAISNIVMKLLKKNPKDRYQGVYALLNDLTNCLNQFLKKGVIDSRFSFVNDVPEILQLPRKLYDRETQFNDLIANFDKVKQGSSECILVEGYAGIGKSTLISSLLKPVTKSGGYFVLGKYDKFQSDIPYSAIIQAFQDLVKQILQEGSRKIDKWKTNLLLLLGSNGQVIVDVVPEIELIIGKQPKLPVLAPAESQNRFRRACENVFKAFTTKEHPLVLFLDDLQWADSSSLQLLETFLRGYVPKYFFLLGAYRNNELDDDHPFISVLKNIQEDNSNIQVISLNHLSETHVGHLIADALCTTENDAASLASITFEKTRGNPFFIGQFLKSLYSENLLFYDFETGIWKWDIDRIRKADITDNVVDLLSFSIRKLSENAQESLKAASCIGNPFDLNTLSIVCQKDHSETLADLLEAIREGFIISLGEDLNSLADPIFVKNIDTVFISNSSTVTFGFVHERVRQVVYSLIPTFDRNALHLKIGHFFLDNTDDQYVRDKVFYIVSQFNSGIDLVTDKDEKSKLAGFFFLAGNKAKDSNAYYAAANYLRTGISLLPSFSWKDNYDLLMEVKYDLAECEYLSGNHIEAEYLFVELINNARSHLDKAKVHNLRIILYTNIGKIEEAFNVGLETAGLLGVKVPFKPSKLSILLEYTKLKLYLQFKGVHPSPVALAPNHAEKELLLDVLAQIGTISYYANPRLIAYIILKIGNLSLRRGMTDIVPYSLITFALILESGFGNYQEGHHYARLGIDLLEKHDANKYHAKAYFSYAYFIQHWRGHANKNIQLLRKACSLGFDLGDLIFAGHSINVTASYRLIIGDNIDEVFDELEQHREFINQLKDPFISNNYLDYFQIYKNLKGLTDHRHTLNTEDYDQEQRLSVIRKEKNTLALFMHLNVRLRILYLFGKYQECLTIATEIEQLEEFPLGSLYIVEFYFYYSLSLTALCRNGTVKNTGHILNIVKTKNSKMKKWAHLCPENFLHKNLLISAELANIKGKDKKAMDLYQRAIVSARENGYKQVEALAKELSAVFYLNRGFDEIAKAFLEEARDGYLRWGATSKVDDLEEKYPILLPRLRSSTSISTRTQIEYETVVNTLQTISREIDPNNLLKNLMTIVSENAGAQKGLFITSKENGLFVEAITTKENREVDIIDSHPIDKRNDLSLGVVNYVDKSKEYVVLNDAENEGDFVSDPYVMKNHPKSILCLPVIQQSKLVAILYLENNITTGAFTVDRIEFMRLLASQAAISFENARLYDNLFRYQEQLRLLSSELILTEERSRRKIANDLHDRIGHALANAKLKIGLMKDISTSNGIGERLEEIQLLIDQTIKDTRSLTFELSPPVLYELGLVPAMEWLAEQIEMDHHIHVEFNDDMKEKELDDSTRILIFQAARELLFNVVKHSNAKKVAISITKETSNIRIDIRDDGVGFDEANISQSGGFGLFSIRERLSQLGGYLEIESQTGLGTRITMVSPMQYE